MRGSSKTRRSAGGFRFCRKKRSRKKLETAVCYPHPRPVGGRVVVGMLLAATIATLPKLNQTAEAYRPLYRLLEHSPVHPGCQAIGMLWPSGAD